MSNYAGSGQLALPVRLDDGATFENFYLSPSSANQATLHSLKQSAQSLYLWGAEGAGISHLLQAFCKAQETMGRSTIYVPLKDFAKEQPDQVLSGLESLDAVCLDDLDTVSSDTDWSEALFHFYNRSLLNQTTLILGAKRPAAQIETPLADLKSRLGALLSCKVEKLSDDELIEALRDRAKRRGMDMPASVAEYMVTRFSRKLSDQFDALDTLDRVTLLEQRKLTIPFIKKVLEA